MPKILYLLPLAACCTIASAQVYESADDQGNPVFSDQPSAGGKPIEVPEPNLGDAVSVPPPEPTPEERPEIVADPAPLEVEGEMIGVKKKKSKKRKKRPTPHGG